MSRTEASVANAQEVDAQEAAWLRPRSRRHLAVTVPLLLGFIALVGFLDVVAGTELTVTPFYVPAVIYAARRMGRLGSVCAALACAAVGVLADYLVSEPFLTLSTSYHLPQVPWWNGLARLLVYLMVGATVTRLRNVIHQRNAVVGELSASLAHARTLQGLLPICAWCRRIRDEEHDGCWMPLEQFVAQKTPAEFTHGICPPCASQLVGQTRRAGLQQE